MVHRKLAIFTCKKNSDKIIVFYFILDKMDLKIMTDQFRQFQLERRQRYTRRFKKNMTTFESVNVQKGEHNQFFLANKIVNQGIGISIVPVDPHYVQGRHIIVYEDIETYDDRRDSLKINLIEGRSDPLIIFDSADEKRRFVLTLGNFLNYSNNPEENPGQLNQEQQQVQGENSDSGRDSAFSSNSNENI